MTPVQLRQLLAYLNISHEAFARELQVHRVTVTRWAAGRLNAHHRGIGRPEALMIRSAARRIAKEKQLPLEPLKDFFSHVESRG